ncbi:MAG: dephospho-CoA kinase [Thermoanaerobaculum sp.]|nr:MAG: dephospho-CoA kinase [Thermoanaerobaculum sp.]
MLRVGLTGGLGAGKSTLARFLAQKGAAVRDADGVVEELYLPQGAAVLPLARAFGERILTAQGGVDREKLKALVAADPSALLMLNRIVHPLVRAEMARWFEELEHRPQSPLVAVVEAALLVETGSFRQYHRLVVVTAPASVRRERAAASGLSPEVVRRLMEAQADDETKRKVAHYVVDNSGTLAELEAKAEALWQHLLADAQAVAEGRPLSTGPALVL